jgi:hypothetical protein
VAPPGVVMEIARGKEAFQRRWPTGAYACLITLGAMKAGNSMTLHPGLALAPFMLGCLLLGICQVSAAEGRPPLQIGCLGLGAPTEPGSNSIT